VPFIVNNPNSASAEAFMEIVKKVENVLKKKEGND
jgi:MinD-like ATPase involved in chromosome partitioning or flagellar assembly